MREKMYVTVRIERKNGARQVVTMKKRKLKEYRLHKDGLWRRIR
mgnify:CR=1 FL=1